jgi:hypothetical protein
MKKRQKTTEKEHPTNSEVQRIIKDIRTLRDSNKSDIEIRALLGIELRTYQRYTKRIHEEDQNAWLSITQEQYATELLRLRSCLNNAYNIAKQLSEDSKLACQDRLAALQSMLDSRLSMVQLLGDVDMKRKISTTVSQPELEEQDSTIKASTFKRIH